MSDPTPLPVFPVRYAPRPARRPVVAPARPLVARVALSAALALYVVQLALVLAWVAAL